MAKAKVTNRLPQFHIALTATMATAMQRMAKDVLQQAKTRVPIGRGDLSSAGRALVVTKLHHQVRFDSVYAAYQERGRRKDGSHVVKNYSTPATGKDFLKGAGEKVSKNTLQYLQQAADNTKGTG